MVEGVKEKVDSSLKPEDVKTAEPKVDEQVPEKIDPSKFVDKEAMAEIQRQNAELAEKVNTLSGVTKKLEDVKTAITGQESEKLDSEKFFKDFAEDPQKALDGYYDRRSKKELEPIKKKLEESAISEKNRAMAEQDRIAFGKLQAHDPNYLDVMKNVNTYIGKEELTDLLKYPNRTEVIYSIAKSRMAVGEAGRKMEETQATKQAKDDANKTAVSEAPAGGKIEQETDKQRRRKNINEAIENGDWKNKRVYDDAFDEYWENTSGGKK